MKGKIMSTTLDDFVNDDRIISVTNYCQQITVRMPKLNRIVHNERFSIETTARYLFTGYRISAIHKRWGKIKCFSVSTGIPHFQLQEGHTPAASSFPVTTLCCEIAIVHFLSPFIITISGQSGTTIRQYGHISVCKTLKENRFGERMKTTIVDSCGYFEKPIETGPGTHEMSIMYRKKEEGEPLKIKKAGNLDLYFELWGLKKTLRGV